MEIITGKEFEEVTKKGVVLVDFFATWCAPCRMMGMMLEEIEEETKDQFKIVKVDVDNDEAIARKFGILSIPTLILFVNGELKEKHVGIWQKDDLIETVKSYL